MNLHRKARHFGWRMFTRYLVVRDSSRQHHKLFFRWRGAPFLQPEITGATNRTFSSVGICVIVIFRKISFFEPVWDLKRMPILPSRKWNSSHLNMDGWNPNFLLGWPIFRCELLVLGSVIRIDPLFPVKKTWVGQNRQAVGWQKISKLLRSQGDWPWKLRTCVWWRKGWERKVGEENCGQHFWDFHWIWFLGCLIWRAYQSYWCSLCSI